MSDDEAPAEEAGLERQPRFFQREREAAGWRFWVLWVAATNAGFFPGLVLGNRLSAGLAEPLASGGVSLSFGALVGFAQWLVLRRHLEHCVHWITSTAFGWALGAFLGSWLFSRFAPGLSPSGAVGIVSIGFFAGAIVGIPQRQLLLRSGPDLARHWVPLSSFAWGVFFPGVISGWVLGQRLTRRAQARPPETR